MSKFYDGAECVGNYEPCRLVDGTSLYKTRNSEHNHFTAYCYGFICVLVCEVVGVKVIRKRI